MFNSFVVRLQSLEKNRLKDVSKDIYNYINEITKDNSKGSYFTVSNFLKNDKFNLELEEGKYYLFRISTLDIETFSFLTSYLFKQKILNNSINIGESNFIVKEIVCDEDKNKYASRFDIDKFRYINSDKCDIKEYKIKLTTPTVFKIGSRFYSEISSEMIFRNLLSKFNKYSEYTIDKEYIKELCNINIDVYNKVISNIKIDRGIYECIRCGINISLEDLDDKSIKVARTLIEFSLYSGIGYKSEIGFGSVAMV